MKNKPDPALLRPSNLYNEIKKRLPKSRETIPLNNRFGANCGMPTLFKSNGSSKSSDFLCGMALDLKGVHAICQNSRRDASKICLHVAVVRYILWASR
jgi:hypothetical protein